MLRGGRRFKSCHSDQHLADPEAASPTDILVEHPCSCREIRHGLKIPNYHRLFGHVVTLS